MASPSPWCSLRTSEIDTAQFPYRGTKSKQDETNPVRLQERNITRMSDSDFFSSPAEKKSRWGDSTIRVKTSLFQDTRSEWQSIAMQTIAT